MTAQNTKFPRIEVKREGATPFAIGGSCYRVSIKNKNPAAYQVTAHADALSSFKSNLAFTAALSTDLLESGDLVEVSLSVTTWSDELPSDVPVGQVSVRFQQDGGADTATVYFDVYFDSSWKECVLKLDSQGWGTPDRFVIDQPILFPCTVCFEPAS